MDSAPERIGKVAPGRKKATGLLSSEKAKPKGKNNWIANATKNKGGLHRSLGIAAGKKIPVKKIDAAAKRKGKVGAQARLAKTLEGLR